MNLQNWIFLYIFFELKIIKNLGYDPNLSKFSKSTSNLNDVKKIKIDNFFYEIPEFLIQKKIPEQFNNLLIKKSLFFTRSLILNKFFIPNNLVFPKIRVLLENYFNRNF